MIAAYLGYIQWAKTLRSHGGQKQSHGEVVGIMLATGQQIVKNKYQDCLTEIKNRKAKLYTTTKLQELLRLKLSHTAQFVNSMNKMADMLLKKDFSYWSC